MRLQELKNNYYISVTPFEQMQTAEAKVCRSSWLTALLY